ncbi:MAG: class E sortase [Streptosporangiaceae bacterium]
MAILEETEKASGPAAAGPPPDAARPGSSEADWGPPSAAAQAEAAPGKAGAAPGTRQRPVLRGVGIGLTLLGVFLLGFAVYLYGLSGVQEARSQTILYSALKIKLANQVAPLGATTPGTPVAILNIPSIGVRNMVVVEGTSPENLTLGPGHQRDTPLPGQNGVSQIYGRRATFGAPFARLDQLRRGDKISVITGQGTSSYTVEALGSSRLLVQDPAANRLILLTAGSPYVPSSYIYADADLTSAVHQDPGGLPAITPAETALSGDDSALVLTMVWGMALALVSAAGTVAAARWSPWLAYLAAAPLALAVLWNLYQSLAALLPNVY